MVYLGTSDEWQRQSALLLQARPTTTRITTKYKIPNLETPKYQISKKRRREGGAEEKEDGNGPRVPRAVLVLKTYDHESGACLKFKTDRAAEVGRLIAGLGRLGRHMAALPEKAEDVLMEDARLDSQTADAVPATTAPPEAKPPLQTGGSGGGKKKKKGKK